MRGKKWNDLTYIREYHYYIYLRYNYIYIYIHLCNDRSRICKLQHGNTATRQHSQTMLQTSPLQNDRNRSDSIQSFMSSIFSTTSNNSVESISSSSSLDCNLDCNTNNDKSTDFLQYIDPKPASPPDYSDININKQPSFPIWESHSISQSPPLYSPTVYHYTLISMRTEFNNPYCKLPQFKSKIWQNFILEINSTQINLYNIHQDLTKHIQNYSMGVIPNNILSSFQRKQAHQIDQHDHNMIIDLIKNAPDVYLNQSTLYDSFSLQYAKCGLPLDFLYRNFVNNNNMNDNEFTIDSIPDDKIILNIIKSIDHKYLRIRLEDKQFLLKFNDVETMLKWYQYINIGTNVALDLDLREFPNYRIVPRRRANQYRDYHDVDSDDDDDSASDVESLSSSQSSQSSLAEPSAKYCPANKIYTYETFLNQSIRCIKPFRETKTWQNRIIVTQTDEPSFTTVNLPIYFHPQESNFKIKNHSLNLALLNDQNNVVSLDHQVVVSWNHSNNTPII